MNENKHQFHVGDWVNLKPFFRPQGGFSDRLCQLLTEAHRNNPHMVVKVCADNTIRIDAPGLEHAYFRPGCLELAFAATNAPIDDLI